jgi:Carboxypeptidase regulatory-like domain/TonB dependent receptor
MNKRPSFAILFVLAFCSCASPCLAQTDTARLLGTITDAKDAVIVGATVTVTNLDTSRALMVQTNETGAYVINALTPGRYRIEVKQQGFKTVSQEVTLEVSQVAAISFKLDIGAVNEVVNVTGGAPLVESASSALGTVVEGPQVAELPLNGRNFTQLATLVPGVTRGIPDGDASGARGNAETFRYGDSGGAALSVNGLREQFNNFMMDGVDNNETLVNTIVFFPPAEAIREFRVQTSIAPAEFGRAGGAVVNTAIKSGTNEFHGSAFEFLRNDELDARSFFESPTAPKREFRRNQFGGTLGGPVMKNKLFIFGDYQGWRQFLPIGRELATVPTDKMRAGDFSELLPGTPIIDPTTGLQFMGNGAQPNVIPANRINPVGQNYLKAFPEPNCSPSVAPDCKNVLQNFAGNRTQVQSFNDFDIRVDWNFRANDQVFGRVSYGQDTSTTSSRLGILPSGFGSGSNFNHPRGVALGDTHLLGTNVINEARFGFLRTFYGFIPPFDDVTLSKNLGIPNANTSPLLGGGALIGGFNNQIEYTGDFGPFLVPQNSFQFADSLSWVRGRHTLKFGGNIIRRQLNLFRPNRGKGFFFLFGNGSPPSPTHYEVSDILAGFVNNYTIGPPFGTVGTRSWEDGFFAQDDWRVTSRLTLNLGVRYDYLSWPTEVLNRQANFDPVSGKLLIAGQNGNSQSLIPQDKNNFAPRVGFAYALTGDSRTVLRGGYGLFYFIDRGGIDNQLAQNPPFSGFAEFDYAPQGVRIALSGRAPDNSNNSTLATGPLPLGFLTNLDPNNPANVTVFAALQSNVTPYVQQWNLQMQRQLDNNTAFSLGYVGTQGKKLTSYYNLNKPRFNLAPSDPNSKRFPKLGDVHVQETRGNSIYHSLQAHVERRLAKGWQLLASYTWAHTIDDSIPAFNANGSNSQPQDPTNFALERGNSDLDVRHRFVFSTLYELPFGRGRQFGSDMSGVLNAVIGGWQVNGILIFQSGLPFDLNTSGFPGDVRPDIVGPIRIHPDNLSAYFDKPAFAPPPTAVLGGSAVFVRPGNAGRNILRGPGVRNIDFSIFKNFPITERFKAQFRAEFYNLTNTPRFSNPDGNLGDGPRFGTITSVAQSSEREIQLALRIQF